MAISLKTAKARTLRRWRKILADYPNVKLVCGFINVRYYGRCGFCEKYTGCRGCPLVKIGVCGVWQTEAEFSYWRILSALRDKRECRAEIKQLLAAVEAVKEE